ncbi:hypothetical protein ACSFBX_17310 [Variovorax sp. RB2P76]|uniref:hypothetical protein n=1 Tax=unclassified Variovorax TaxID=663243 RepID=UPI003F470BBF
MNTFRSASLLRPSAPRSHRARAEPKSKTKTTASLDAVAHSEQHHGRWEIHYRLEPAREKFAGTAQIHCDGLPHCELSIFEPQSNALASIDLLREQCLAWIAHRSDTPAARALPAN